MNVFGLVFEPYEVLSLGFIMSLEEGTEAFLLKPELRNDSLWLLMQHQS